MILSRTINSLFLFLPPEDHLGGIALKDDVVGVAAVDEAVGDDDRVVADHGAVGDRRARAHPDIVADADPARDHPDILEMHILLAMGVILADDVDVGAADEVAADLNSAFTRRDEAAI